MKPTYDIFIAAQLQIPSREFCAERPDSRQPEPQTTNYNPKTLRTTVLHTRLPSFRKRHQAGTTGICSDVFTKKERLQEGKGTLFTINRTLLITQRLQK